MSAEPAFGQRRHTFIDQVNMRKRPFSVSLKDTVYFGYLVVVCCVLCYLIAFPQSAASWLDPVFSWVFALAQSLARGLPAWAP